MLKKNLFVGLILFLFGIGNVFGQDTVYEEPLKAYVGLSGNSVYDMTCNNMYMTFTDGLEFQYMITNKMSWITDVNLFLSSNSDRPCGLYLSSGVKYNIWNGLHITCMVRPFFDVKGISHQVYGDYVGIYGQLNFGLMYEVYGGYRNTFYISAGVSPVVTILAPIRELYRDDVSLCVGIGYRYRFN